MDAQRAGVDAGATLCKIVIDDRRGPFRREVISSRDLAAIVRVVGPAIETIGLTGGGSSGLVELVGGRGTIVSEFESWRLGVEYLGRTGGWAGGTPQPPFLVVSMGTGTLVFKMADGGVARVASSAIGGGTIVALGRLIAGAADFEALCALAATGHADNVDTRIRDVYPDGGFEMPADVISVAFGKVGAGDTPAGPFAPSDLAAGLMRMVGEHVASLVSATARSHGVRQVVIGGSAVSSNPILTRTLHRMLLMNGLAACFAPSGQHVGAIGAMLAATRDRSGA